jgi:hypothetical protein
VAWLQHALLFSVVAVMSGCEQPHESVTNATEKVEGPDVKRLSHVELMEVLHECHRFGASDDPKVKYTVRYCSAAQSAHAMEGYAVPSAAPVDPSLNKLH